MENQKIMYLKLIYDENENDEVIIIFIECQDGSFPTKT